MGTLLGLPQALVRATARLLLLALSVTTLGPVLHDDHDADWVLQFVLHDENHHQFQADLPDDDNARAGDHCVACHFVRASRGPISWEPAGLADAAAAARLLDADGAALPTPFTSQRPARAPPLA